MKTFSAHLQHWQQTLKEIYPEREIANIFRYILEDVFDRSPAEQLVQRDQLVDATISEQLQQIEARLLKGEPMQYITGFTYFDELKIRVSPAVLIPRPETEELVQLVADSLPADFLGTIIDWCTGSGCVALALKNRFTNASIHGYDWSEPAIEMAIQNQNNLQLAVDFQLKNALEAEENGPKVDVIVSNPPYIPENEQTRMRTNVVSFEPHIALFVPNESALLFYQAITEKAIQQLVPGGILAFELHEDYALATQELVQATMQFSSVEIHQDLSGKNRMLKAIRN